MKSILINGVEYPCRQTLGGMLRFKRETGKEVTSIKEGDISDIAVLVWCYVKSACNADKVEFPYSLEDFADSIDPETLTKFFDVEKKKEK